MSNTRKKLESKSSKLTEKRESINYHPAKQYYGEGDFKIIPIELITPDPNQPRKNFDQTLLEELSESIKNNGVLQPIIVRVDVDNNVWLVAGERRFRASKMAGLSEIPAIISKGNPAEVALIENIQREDLNPIEEAAAYERMIDEFGYTQSDLSKILGKGQSNISETLSLNKLPETIRVECSKIKFPKSILIEMVKLDTDKQIDVFNSFLKDGFVSQKKIRENRKRERNKPIDIIISKIDNVIVTLKKLNLDNLDDTDKTDLLNKYSEFYEYIEKILSPVNTDN